MRDHDPSTHHRRVTNPERFASLHAIALELLDRLTREFEVARVEAHALDPQLEEFGVRRPSVRLEPPHGAAPLVVVFTSFPGLRVRFGRWGTAAFPVCGCDGCAETADDEAARFEALVRHVVGGRLRERLIEEPGGARFIEWEHWSDDAVVRHRHRLAPDDETSDTAPRYWRPWPRRAAV